MTKQNTRRPKDNADAQIMREIQEATTQPSTGTPRVRDPQVSTAEHYDRASVLTRTERREQERLGIAELASPAVLPPLVVL